MHHHSVGSSFWAKKTLWELKNNWPQEVLNPLLHFLSPQAPLHSLTLAMCPLQFVWEGDLVTFECPIKRRSLVRGPPQGPIQARYRRTTHTLAWILTPPISSFFFMLTSPVCSASFPHKHSPSLVKDPPRIWLQLIFGTGGYDCLIHGSRTRCQFCTRALEAVHYPGRFSRCGAEDPKAQCFAACLMKD